MADHWAAMNFSHVSNSKSILNSDEFCSLINELGKK